MCQCIRELHHRGWLLSWTSLSLPLLSLTLTTSALKSSNKGEWGMDCLPAVQMITQCKWALLWARRGDAPPSPPRLTGASSWHGGLSFIGA